MIFQFSIIIISIFKFWKYFIFVEKEAQPNEQNTERQQRVQQQQLSIFHLSMYQQTPTIQTGQGTGQEEDIAYCFWKCTRAIVLFNVEYQTTTRTTDNFCWQNDVEQQQ